MTSFIQINDKLEDYLKGTDLIDCFHYKIVNKANEVTILCNSNKDKAVALYNFVRDEIKFGYCSKYYDMKASEVLDSKIGYSFTKTTLLLALLRAIQIPCRPIFVDIKTEILNGYAIPGEYMDHCYCEIFLFNHWIKIDGYIIDKELYSQVSEQIIQQNILLGYGVHFKGGIVWDGENDCFVQYVNDNSIPQLSMNQWGCFKDCRAFYEEVENSHNRYDMFWPLNYIMALSIILPNRRIESARKGKFVLIRN